jgi:4-hydroxy-tetrahydrodipicolinate reductase
MKIALFGYGKTGSRVAELLAEDESVSLVWIATSSGKSEFVPPQNITDGKSAELVPIFPVKKVLTKNWLKNNHVDVAIDFSSTEAIMEYGQTLADAGVKLVTCVSAYGESQHGELNRLSKKTAVLWSPNITLGINFLLMAAKAIKAAMPGADISVTEEHFREKPEMSGTAVRIANELGTDTAAINMIRAGGILGVHEVLFGYDNELLRLRHESINRKAFGAGALFAAKALLNQKKGLFKMEDILAPYFRQSPKKPGLLRKS